MSEQKDMLIDAASGHLSASKRASHQQFVRSLFSTLINFLQDNGLTSRTLLADGEEVSSATEIWRSDLTDDGFTLMMSTYHKWLSRIDRGAPVEDVRVLKNALQKIRREK